MEYLEFLINYLEYIFWFILVFTVIVFIHEFGHYYIAKLNGVEVEKFSIGFGPVLFYKVDNNNTVWQFCAIPLGGYVKFAGEMYAKNNSAKNTKLFMHKKPLQKASIVIAGPVANFLLSLILFIFVFLFFGKNYTDPIVGVVDKGSPAAINGIVENDKLIAINEKKIDSFDTYYSEIESNLFNVITLEILRDDRILNKEIVPKHINIKTFIGSEKKVSYIGIKPLIRPIIGNVIKNSPAEIAGLLPNDKIVKIDDAIIYDARQVINIVQKSPNINLKFKIERKNKSKVIIIKPSSVAEKDTGKIGITFKRIRTKLNLQEAISLSIKSILEVSSKTLIAFSEILFGKRDHCEVGGPILIAKVSNDVANTDMIAFISLIALISINLGLINLFPLPLLDGEHFFTYIAEFFIGKNINYNFFKIIQILGVIIIVSFMLFSIINDIYCRVLN